GEDYIRNLVEKEGKSAKDVSVILQSRYPNARGFSSRTIQRFCNERGIKSTAKISDDTLDTVVEHAVSQVGPVFGRKMIKGLLDSTSGKSVASEGRVGASLARVSPCYSVQRKYDTARLRNPLPYYAGYYGHKLHMDQNEKLVMFGVVYVCCIDGFSRYVPAFAVMPVKNNPVIYEEVYRKVVTSEGLFDQIRVDHGKEFYLSLFIQEQLAPHRSNPALDPHRQTQSKQGLGNLYPFANKNAKPKLFFLEWCPTQRKQYQLIKV
ncbi:hypothetical protein QZH41_017473, partial [Actinostola sp. cb2023]